MIICQNQKLKEKNKKKKLYIKIDVKIANIIQSVYNKLAQLYEKVS